MSALVLAALGYTASIFALGFVLGAVRVLWAARQLGEVAAVLVELPLMLVASWLAAGFWTARLRTPAREAAALTLGALSLALLLAAEFGLATAASGSTPRQFLQTYAAPAGWIGLAGQAVFALIPWLRLRRSKARGRRS